LTRLPTPFLPLYDSEIKRLAKLPGLLFGTGHGSNVMRIFAKAGNRMGTARRCNLARLFLTLRLHQLWYSKVMSHSEGIQILTRVSESVLFHEHFPDPPTKTPAFPLGSPLVSHFAVTVMDIRFDTDTSSEDSLILPEGFIKELGHARLLR
jgi:hypothetical protein